MKFYKYKIDYFLIFLLIGISTIPFCKKTSLCLLLIIFILFYVRRKIVIPKHFILFLFFIFFLEIFHYLLLPRYEFAVLRDQIIYFVIAGLSVFYLKDKFLFIYIKTLYFFTCLSFVVFLTYQISKSMVVSFSKMFSPFFLTIEKSALYEYERISPIFYNFDGNFLELGRNNGPFWEPTVFATMLIIAQIFNLILSKYLFNKQGVIFSLGILSTFSTTGYITYSLFVFLYLIYSKNIARTKKIIFISITTFMFLMFFSSLSFLEGKINNEINNVSSDISDKGGDSRMASAVLDLYEIQNDPLTLIFGKGNSKFYRVNVVKDASLVVLRNCGDTALIVQWGIPFFILYFLMFFYSFKRICKKYNFDTKIFPFFFCIVFLILGFSEVFFELPFFHCFLFLGFAIYPIQKKKIRYGKNIYNNSYLQ